jgi:hypothetical protein
LHQGEGFEGFIHCAETSREESDGVRVFYEVQFAGEEVFKSEKLAVSANGFVGFLFERKFNVKGKPVLATCSCLSGAHDTLAPACDDHVTRFLH